MKPGRDWETCKRQDKTRNKKKLEHLTASREDVRIDVMIYLKPHTKDNRETELCEACQWRKLCNAENKTYAPLLTACACATALLDWASKDVKQDSRGVYTEENALRKSQNYAVASLLLQRLFCADILCDTPHVNDNLRTALKEWLGKYYGKDYAAKLEEHPNENKKPLPDAPHPTPKGALDTYTEADPWQGGLLC